MIDLAVMSLWTAPAKWRGPGEEMRWSLSTHLIRKQFERLRLVTDSAGAEWATGLGLPFTEIRTDLDALNPNLAPAWCLGKCMAYTTAGEPFIHFDSDVFLFGQIPERILEARFTAERPELWLPNSEFQGWNLIASWKEALRLRDSLSWNFGTFGGVDHEAIGGHFLKVLLMAGFNVDLLKGVETGELAVFLEQWGFGRSVDHRDVSCLFGVQADVDRTAKGFYTHWAGPMKFQAANVRRIAKRLEVEWPGQVARCAVLAPCTADARAVHPGCC